MDSQTYNAERLRWLGNILENKFPGIVDEEEEINWGSKKSCFSHEQLGGCCCLLRAERSLKDGSNTGMSLCFSFSVALDGLRAIHHFVLQSTKCDLATLPASPKYLIDSCSLAPGASFLFLQLCDPVSSFICPLLRKFFFISFKAYKFSSPRTLHLLREAFSDHST